MSTTDEDFAATLLAWFDRHGRHDLPWQHPRTPYRVWLSEVMLQQTQVSVVLGYFQRFVAALPDLPALAAASEEQVLALWSGLGYYSRARNLHRAARTCMERHGGELPRDLGALSALPGIGRSTAGAILAQAHGLRTAILDGNVKRVLARVHGVPGWPGSGATARELWRLSELHLPADRMADYTQALMDFGATLCSRARPACGICPLAGRCIAQREGTVAQLPAPKPARAVPLRECFMLLLSDQGGRVLLEHRRQPGVWQGLWSLPEASDLPSARAIVARHGARLLEDEACEPFLHAFSHYRLAVTPLRAVVERPDRIADDAGLRWVDAGGLATLGLPAPVRRLLARELAAAIICA